MKWIEDLNVPETMKLLKEKKKEKFPCHWSSQWFFYGYDPQSASNKSKNQLGTHQTEETSL